MSQNHHSANLVEDLAVLRPPYDPLLVPAVETSKKSLPDILELESLRNLSGGFELAKILEDFPSLDHAEYSVPGLNQGDPEVVLSILRPKDPSNKLLPAFYHIHGGGQVAGNRFSALGVVMEYLAGIETVFISVEYRLAPEHRAPAALHDAYAGLLWVAEHTADLGIDGSKMIVCGGSGGAPIAAGTTMLCRNKEKPFPGALMLLTPMLDDRVDTVSSKQFEKGAPWCGITNRMAWDHVLGSERAGPRVSELIAPARATDLTGLPPTFVDAGACEVFRDEAVRFALKLWECGVSAELHVWPGAYHGFDMLGETAPVAVAARSAKLSWIKRVVASWDA
ncbi:uncharacterized protein NECHADRAFT_42774 [Fusarium vanettenii 77-13-4]|uniref:Alpha/beta hydrolase fold-3 domain-containing protein n=1 Tax=Fusarium vanettenii (strain ATCC MYA-4622 / CBS 123669 / FGSC 9596 / NRRL 45880 / 77-13-4) TaxID=660122 RepID=C7ZKQ6_FUSV7|nr:uncharacterized protein NECHADRAFT_42774 [Fusarium vanettenii 77-13-4]EEU35337.1 hypothetical protein NECHADRAFT_42774 [Fusarium vanettenii 77-13-4]